MMRLSAWLAVAVGVALGLAQAVRNMDNLINWPTWILDEAAAAMLIVAGLMSLRRRGSRLLIAGWGVSLGLYGSTLVSHLLTLRDLHSAELRSGHIQLSLVIAALCIVSLVGLALTMEPRKTTPA